MNPFISTAFPQGLTESTLAHELQHVRQLRRQTPIDRLKELVIPYNERPMEKEADQAAEQYDILMGGKKGWTKTWNADPTIFEQLPKMLKKGK